MLGSATVRLVLRALLAGVATFATSLGAAGTLDRSAVIGAVTAAVWAALEAGTPLNALVGINKPGTVAPGPSQGA